jgi:hypothetical protein
LIVKGTAIADTLKPKSQRKRISQNKSKREKRSSARLQGMDAISYKDGLLPNGMEITILDDLNSELRAGIYVVKKKHKRSPGKGQFHRGTMDMNESTEKYPFEFLVKFKNI